MAEVCVYFNLTTKLWTITAVSGRDNRGRKIESVRQVTIRNARAVVKESRRQAIIAALPEKKREVMAWLIGEIVDDGAVTGAATPFTFNPYRCGDFTARLDGRPIKTADFVQFGADGKAIAYGATA